MLLERFLVVRPGIVAGDCSRRRFLTLALFERMACSRRAECVALRHSNGVMKPFLWRFCCCSPCQIPPVFLVGFFKLVINKKPGYITP